VTEIESLYRQHDGILVVELVLHSVLQLFNNLDPAPFQEKELDAEAEDYIYNVLDEIPYAREVELVVYLPPPLATPENQDAIVLGIRNHFLYKVAGTVREQRRLFREGRIVLLIALTVLFLSLLARQILLGFPGTYITHMLGEALLIVGWVAMWEPVSIFLYGWWPIYHRRRMYKKIAAMEVFVQPLPDGGIPPVLKVQGPVTPESLGAL